jgi:uncharacterized LabA/DUF88 family protein
MDRVAVFVDAGYVFAQGSLLLAGRKLPRAEATLAHEEAVKAFGGFGMKVSGVPLLRVYWYDGTSTGPTAQHLTLAHLQDVKVRLGFVNSVGEQKGVDSLIVTDMITLARNRAISDAVLVSGDEDLRVGVQQAQEFGVRVHLIGIKPSRGSQSLFLLQEADTTHEWSTDEVSAFLKCQPNPTLEATAPIVPVGIGPAEVQGPLKTVASQVAARLEQTEIKALLEAVERAGQIPRDIDKQLLGGGRAAIERDLNSAEKFAAAAGYGARNLEPAILIPLGS